MQNKNQHSPSATKSNLRKSCDRATLEAVKNSLEIVVFGQILAHPLCKAGRFLVVPWVISAKVSKIVKHKRSICMRGWNSTFSEKAFPIP